jgi:hypothetical protein
MVTDARRAIVEGHAALGIELGGVSAMMHGTDCLNTKVFADTALDTVEPNAPDAAGFDAFIQRFVDALPVERAAVDHTDIASSSGSAAAGTR